MDPDQQLYGVPRLRKVLTGQAVDCALDTLQKYVLESVETFTRGAPQADDLTLLIVRYRGASAGMSTDTAIPAAVPASA
jgi:sigma-B regulation protein RsbU (phosphoserine phosphatase)